MKLYYSPGVCSLSPHIALQELGISAELIKVDTEKHVLEDGTDYFSINPHGYVPILEFEDGRRMTEGPAIVQFLADLKPELRLAPPNGSMERYRLQELLGFINSELHKAYSALFDPMLPEENKAEIRTKIGKRLSWLNAKLEGQAFLMGEQFTVADAYLFTVVEWSRFVSIDLHPWPNLKAHIERVRQRPAVRTALRAEGLLK